MTHHASGPGLTLEVALLVAAACVVAAYGSGVLVSRRRGRPWPAYRFAFWAAGTALATVSVVGPLAETAHTDFLTHMQAHLLVGMLAPLLLALAAPVTLALRTLDPVPARRLSRMLRSGPAQTVAHPITAGLLVTVGLLLLYTTPVYGVVQTDAVAHLLAQAHLLAAGYLLSAAVVGVDPEPHGPRRRTTAVVLVLVLAAHGALAKWLYAHPPPGVPLDQAERGAELMYYGGALVEAVLVTVFCARWYRAAGRHHEVARRPAARSRRRFSTRGTVGG